MIGVITDIALFMPRPLPLQCITSIATMEAISPKKLEASASASTIVDMKCQMGTILFHHGS